MRTSALILVFLLLAGCTTTTGYWRFVHDVNGPEETQSDLAICKVGWLSSPMAAEFERQKAATETTDWGLLARINNARDRHVGLCMRALNYKEHWFDADLCQRGCPSKP